MLWFVEMNLGSEPQALHCCQGYMGMNLGSEPQALHCCQGYIVKIFSSFLNICSKKCVKKFSDWPNGLKLFV